MPDIKIACKGSGTLPLNSLTPFQGALKELSKENYQRLKTEIAERGFSMPFAIWKQNKMNYILDGTQRFLTIKQMVEKEGWTCQPLPVVMVEAKDAKEAKHKLLAFVSCYGHVTEQGLYEFMSSAEIDMDMLKTSFDMPTIDFDRFEQEFFTEPVTEDEVPAPPENPVTKRGDLYQLGGHRLLCGDAVNEQDVAKLMDGKKADIVFTDPPYGVSYADKNTMLNEYDKGNSIQKEIKADHKTEAEIKEFWKQSFKIIKSVLAPVNSYYIFGPQIQGMMMMMMMMREAGLPYRHVLIWVKNNHVLGRCDYNYRHEPIFFGWTTKHEFYGNGNYLNSVWEVDKPLKNDLHPTMKPIAIIKNALLNSSKIDNICLDPFGGSGSTLIACEQTNRICYICEIDEAYCDVITKRWENLTGKKAVKTNG